jgi:hypothetical protein
MNSRHARLAAVLAVLVLPVLARAEPAPVPQGQGVRDAAPLGPIFVRPFKPMEISVVTLTERHPPVWFRSPLAEPTPADAAMDRAILPTAGLGMADWFLFTGRVLAFPVEIVLRPPWVMLPLEKP